MCICDPNKRTPICPSCPPEERAKWAGKTLAEGQGVLVPRNQVRDEARLRLEAMLLSPLHELAGEASLAWGPPGPGSSVFDSAAAGAACERAATKIAEELLRQSERMTATECREGAAVAMNLELWRGRALAAENRIAAALDAVPELYRQRAHLGLVRSVELLRNAVRDEQGTREGLEAQLAEVTERSILRQRQLTELDELLRRWYRADGSAETLDTTEEVLARRVAAAAELEHLHGQIDALAKVLLEEFGGPTRSESACEMAVRVLREFRGYVERLRAEAGVPGDRDPSLLLWIRESRKALEAACCSGCGKVLPDRQAAAVHAAGCAQHPLGRRILELEDVVDRVSAYTNRLPVPYAGELREVLGEARR